MLATVRIAPLSEWEKCPQKVRGLRAYAALVVGVEVQIDTASMHDRGCGPAWQLSKESYARINEIAGIPTGKEPPFLCRHQLEMD